MRCMCSCVSVWMVPQMMSHLQLLILSSLAASFPLGETVFFHCGTSYYGVFLVNSYFSPLVLYVLGLDDVFLGPQNQIVRDGEEAVFQCVSGESSPPASITWIKNGEVVRRGRQIQVKSHFKIDLKLT